MTTKIIKGYWDCKYCGEKHIDGLIDECPCCGKRKSEDIKYYIGTSNRDEMEEVTDSELLKAGISKEECDGNHKEWVCGYCGQINNYSDSSCRACGADKSEKSGEYGDIKNQAANDFGNSISVSDNPKAKVLDFAKNARDTLLMAIVLAICFISLFLPFIPYKRTEEVTGFSWNRNVSVEEYKTVYENGWSLPETADLVTTKREIHHYQDVVDHYETKSKQVPEMIPDGTETRYRHSDNGNGTFTQTSYEVPKYKTVYHTEYYQEPVYRSEPVYRTKYYYNIDKWVLAKNYSTSEENKSPYWSGDYILANNQRDTKRSEHYYVKLTDEKGKVRKEEVTYAEWAKEYVGHTYSTIKCLGGIVYKREAVSSTVSSSGE